MTVACALVVVMVFWIGLDLLCKVLDKSNEWKSGGK